MYRVLVPVLSLMLVGAAWAQAPKSEADLTRCKDHDPTVSVANCTTVIQSGADSKTLATAYFYRGLAYAKTLYDGRALPDLDQAIKLDPPNAAAIALRDDIQRDRQGYVSTPDSGAADPRDVDFFVARGVAYMRIRTYDRAIANFDQAIKLDPSRTESFFDRGNAHESNSEFDLAIADYSQAIKLDPTNSRTVLNRAVTYSSDGEYDKALDDFAQAIQLSPKSTDALMTRGAFYVQLRQFDKAIADYDAAIRMTPSEIAYQSRGRAYYQMGDYPHAIADLTKAMGQEGDTRMAWLYRASVYAHQQDWAHATTDFAKAEELGVSVAAEADLYANNLYLDRAIARLDLALAGGRGTQDLYGARAYAHVLNADWDAAIADYTSAIALNPASPALLYWRGLAWRGKGDESHATADFNQAAAVAGQAIDATPHNAFAWNERCWARAMPGLDLADALSDCNAALKLRPNSATILDSRGMVEFRLGKYQSALADYDKALTLTPGQFNSLFMRGVIKIKLGRKEDGNADIAAAKALQPAIEKANALYGIKP